MPIINKQKPCGCRQAQPEPAAGLGFIQAPTQAAEFPWLILAVAAAAALLIYSIVRSTPKRSAKSAARARYRRSLERIERQYA